MHDDIFDYVVVPYLLDMSCEVICGAAYSDLNTIQYLLSIGADVHMHDDLAVRWAAEYGQLEAVKCLVSNGANMHVDDDIAIALAAKNGHLDIIKYLVLNGANTQIHEALAIGWAAEFAWNLIAHHAFFAHFVQLSICLGRPNTHKECESTIAHYSSY